MLKKISNENIIKKIKISETSFNKMFEGGLEYAPPVRGTWNISHTGMLIPESHQIFVCAASCLRGVILTAAEMYAMNRFSTIEVKENMLYDGSMEDVMINGISDIISKLDYTPKVFLVYVSCLHHFMGIDIDMIFDNLRNKFKQFDFIDCYMNPTLRKSGSSPDELMRIRLYRGLKKIDIEKHTVLLCGNDLPMSNENELMLLFNNNNIKKYQITDCKNYNEYLEMAKSEFYITTFPSAKKSAEDLVYRFGGTHIYISNSFDYEEIKIKLNELCEKIKIKNFDEEFYNKYINECEQLAKDVKALIGNKKISIDYTYTTRVLSLARFLLDRGFNVDRIYADSFINEEENDFNYIKNKYPNIYLYSTVNSSMIFANSECEVDEYLAIGQKAAYFTNTNHFVNVVEGGGLFGFNGIKQTLLYIEDAYKNKKNMTKLVSKKGLGCTNCFI